MDTKDSALEILDKVNGFYDSAWTRLIVVSSILIAIIGIVLPIILNFWQNNSLERQEKALKAELESRFSILREELGQLIEEKLVALTDSKISAIETLMEEKIEELRIQSNKGNRRARAAAFHLQGNTMSEQDKFKEASKSYLHAAIGYIEAEDHLNLSRVNKSILKMLIHLGKEDLEELEIEGTAFSTYLERLKGIDSNGGFRDAIVSIRKEYEKAKLRA